MDINSIIEMINNTVRPIGKVHDQRTIGYDDACDDIIEQLRKMSDWQDISTAPKDGSRILTYEKGYTVQISWWDKKHDGERGGFRNAQHGWRPTHWMPVPLPPSKAL